MPTPGTCGAGSIAPGDPTGAQNGIFPASSSPLSSITVPWSRHLFSLTNKHLFDKAGSFNAEQGLYLPVRTPLFP